VLVNDLFDSGEATVGEADTNTMEEKIVKLLDVWNFALELVDNTSHEGVLSENDLGFSKKIVTDV